VVPAATQGTGRAVNLAGELDRLTPPLGVWVPDGQPMNQGDATHWTVTLDGVLGTQLQYKYVLGDWAFVEKDQSRDEIQNRSLTFSNAPQVVNDTVAQWRNVNPCGN
jgi:hypothetical protein